MGLPAFTQVFTPGLDGAGGPDALEIVIGLPACPMTELCVRNADVGNTMVVETKIGVPGLRRGHASRSSRPAVPCGSRAPPPTRRSSEWSATSGTPATPARPRAAPANAFGVTLSLDWAAGPATWRHLAAAGPVPAAYAGAPAAVSGFFVPVQVVRYIVATDPNDASNPSDPNFLHLWRSVTGGRSAGDDWAAPQPAPGPEWQLVARGINDLQVTYVDGNGPARRAPADRRSQPRGDDGAAGQRDPVVPGGGHEHRRLHGPGREPTRPRSAWVSSRARSRPGPPCWPCRTPRPVRNQWK